MLTCGEDNRVMLFDANTKQFLRGAKISDKKMKNPDAKLVGRLPPNKQSKALAYSKKHNHVALCSNTGKTSIRSFEDLEKKV